jgi:NTE family protein
MATNPKRVAIACQGGGSQCAFVAGALSRLLSTSLARFELVGLSGTSGGALTAAVAWQALLRRRQGGRDDVAPAILGLWKDLSAQSPMEMALDQMCTETVRLVERGLLPSFAISPSSPRFQMWATMTARLLGRPEFTDLRALLLKHIDFEGLRGLVQPDSPALLIGAGDVLEGTFKIFSSARGEISVDSLLASAAIPNLFPAVWANGHAYWDGIFASNPPVAPFLRRVTMGKESLPQEIWVIQVNPLTYQAVPETPSDIFARRNQLAGNLSLQHELVLIQIANLLLHEGALVESFRARFGLEATETITVRFIRMSEPLQRSLDYPSKLSRQPKHIDQLIADGQTQAEAFLATLPADPALWPSSLPVDGGRVAEAR